MNNSLKSDATASQDLSSGSLSFTTSFGRRFKLEQVLVKFSQAVTETITITLDSKNGTTYDTVLRARSLSSETNFDFTPEGQKNFQEGDEIKITITNANLVGIAYVTVKASEILI